MDPKDFSPRSEPVAWATIIAAVIAAAGSYGLNVTDELKDLLILIGPFVIAGIVARFSVYAPDTVEQVEHAAYVEGQIDASTPEVA